MFWVNTIFPGPLLQWVTHLTSDPGVASSIPAWSHTFVETGHEIISTAVLLLPLIKEGLLSVTSEVCGRITGKPISQASPGKSVGM